MENPKNEKLLDLNLREVVTFVPLIILALWIGLYPTPFIDFLDTSVSAVVARVSPQYLEQTATKQPDCPENVATSKFTLAPCDPTLAPAEPGDKVLPTDGRPPRDRPAGTRADGPGSAAAGQAQDDGRPVMPPGFVATDF